MVSNFWANSSKNFINQSKIRENAKKLHFGRWRRKQVKNFIRFNRTKIVKRNCQKAMSRLNVSNTLTGNSVHVPGQPKPRLWWKAGHQNSWRSERILRVLWFLWTQKYLPIVEEEWPHITYLSKVKAAKPDNNWISF